MCSLFSSKLEESKFSMDVCIKKVHFQNIYNRIEDLLRAVKYNINTLTYKKGDVVRNAAKCSETFIELKSRPLGRASKSIYLKIVVRYQQRRNFPERKLDSQSDSELCIYAFPATIY